MDMEYLQIKLLIHEFLRFNRRSNLVAGTLRAGIAIGEKKALTST